MTGYQARPRRDERVLDPVGVQSHPASPALGASSISSPRHRNTPPYPGAGPPLGAPPICGPRPVGSQRGARVGRPQASGELPKTRSVSGLTICRGVENTEADLAGRCIETGRTFVVADVDDVAFMLGPPSRVMAGRPPGPWVRTGTERCSTRTCAEIGARIASARAEAARWCPQAVPSSGQAKDLARLLDYGCFDQYFTASFSMASRRV